MRWILFVASPVHIAATAWLYRFPDVRREARAHATRYVWVPLGLIAVVAIAASVLAPATFAWLLIPFFAWQFWHFHKQNVGIVALVAAACGLPTPTRAERRVLATAAVAAIAMVCGHPGLLQLGMRFQLRGIGPATASVFGVSAISGVLVVRRGSTLGYRLCFLTALLFWVPVFVFRSPYAALGGLTVGHGLQYLLLVGSVSAGAPGEPDREWNLIGFSMVGLAVGAALSVVSHLHSAGPHLRALYGAYLGVLMTHFVVDARLWRLRDPFPRRFLSERLPDLIPQEAAALR